MEGSQPRSNKWFLGSTQLSIPNGISIGQPFMHSSLQMVPILCNESPSPKIALSMGRSEPPSNTWFPGPTRVLNPNGISISLAVSAQLTSVTDRLTDHTTRSVTVGRIYVCSTAMQPNTSAPSGYTAVPEAMHERQLCVLRVQSCCACRHIQKTTSKKYKHNNHG